MFSRSKFYSIFLVIFILFLALQLNAQSFGVQASASLPTGDFDEVANAGFNGGLLIQFPVSPFTVTLQGAYGGWDGESFQNDNTTLETSFKAIPVYAGLKYNVASNIYAGGAIGYQFFDVTAKTTVEQGNTKNTTEQSENFEEFTVVPSLGIVLPVGKYNFDFSANYAWNNEVQHFFLNAAFLFGK